jgi:SAM-dependent methyltransferase
MPDSNQRLNVATPGTHSAGGCGLVAAERLCSQLDLTHDIDEERKGRDRISMHVGEMSKNQQSEVTHPLRRLNVGCGRNILAGWINLDVKPLPGVDVVADLELCTSVPLPIEDDSVDEFLLSHVIEHVRDSLGVMQELYRIARANAKVTIRVPYGGSDDAWEDPTHVRAYFADSFGYFSQPYYWRADYGYRADWQPKKITLHAFARACKGLPPQLMLEKIHTQRNIVREMVAELVAIKPARKPMRNLVSAPKLEVTLV